MLQGEEGLHEMPEAVEIEQSVFNIVIDPLQSERGSNATGKPSPRIVMRRPEGSEVRVVGRDTSHDIRGDAHRSTLERCRHLVP